tara:strand:+ start:3242 stop:4114 length:873 start_codon:yes stop_codon:yes gene_type:complete
MIKIYFAPNWGLTSEQMVSDYIKQTPNNTGIWNDITYTLNVNEADYLIIQDSCDQHLLNMFEPNQRLYFSREALTPNVIQHYPKESVVRNSFWDGSGILWTKWWYPNKSNGGINLTYDHLRKEKIIKKNKILSCIQSDKSQSLGHIARKKFLKSFVKKYPKLLDLYGGISFSNRNLLNNQKTFGLDDYKYCLAFDNQNYITSFFGTQFTDSLLRWCVPIYWGGAKLSNFFPEDAYIQIDIYSSHAAEQLVSILEKDKYEDRLEAISIARNQILEKYNMWPVIEKVIEENK